MKIIGLTGTIASGKSTIAQMFRDLHIDVHDADKAVHVLIGPYGKASQKIAQIFGSHLLEENNQIDRVKLGKIVFGDPEARKRLESILHPLVTADRSRFLADMQRRRKKWVVLDVPLLFETGGDAQCDYVVTVWAPYFLLQQRALQRPAMTVEKFSQIVAAQLPQTQKMRLADLALPTGLGRYESRRRLKKWLYSLS